LFDNAKTRRIGWESQYTLGKGVEAMARYGATVDLGASRKKAIFLFHINTFR